MRFVISNITDKDSLSLIEDARKSQEKYYKSPEYRKLMMKIMRSSAKGASKRGLLVMAMEFGHRAGKKKRTFKECHREFIRVLSMTRKEFQDYKERW